MLQTIVQSLGGQVVFCLLERGKANPQCINYNTIVQASLGSGWRSPREPQSNTNDTNGINMHPFLDAIFVALSSFLLVCGCNNNMKDRLGRRGVCTGERRRGSVWVAGGGLTGGEDQGALRTCGESGRYVAKRDIDFASQTRRRVVVRCVV